MQVDGTINQNDIVFLIFFYKLGNRTKNGSVAGMFLLIYVHRKPTSEKENTFFF